MKRENFNTKKQYESIMKNTILVIILLMTAIGCSGGGKESTDDFITVDVRKSYPKKNLILQDIMDVEYIPLETNDDFLTQGRVLAISKNFIVVKNRMNDGNLFIFDRTTGKCLRKINHYGQGPGEYSHVFEISIDEDIGEIFVNTHARKILVYDLDGKFKRILNVEFHCTQIQNFDRENLIGYDFDFNAGGGRKHPLSLISKKDGRITKEIQIPYKKMINTAMSGNFGDNKNMTYLLFAELYPIISYFDNWILFTPSSDTIYSYLPEQHIVTPLIIRTPSVQSLKPKIFLFMNILTDRYYFMETVTKVYNPVTKDYLSIDLVYDKQKKAIFEYKVYNKDYAEKKLISLKPLGARPENDGIAAFQVLECYQLIESYRKGELKGRLKEIAAKLHEEDNPVIMLMKYKK